MAMNPNYEIRIATTDDNRLVQDMAEICAEGRIRAYGIQPGGPDYTLGVDTQRSEQGLAELREQLRLSAEQPHAHRLWVAERNVDKRLAGLCIAQKVLDMTPHVYMDRVFVAEADEGNGIASEFLARIIDWAGDLPVKSEVVVGNDRALGLYKRRGFVVVGKQEQIPGFKTELERFKIVRLAGSEEVA